MDVVSSLSPFGEKNAEDTVSSWCTVCSGLGDDLPMFLGVSCEQSRRSNRFTRVA
jgi:hypothetical protein